MVTLDAQAPKAWLSDLHMWRCALRARATGVLFHIVQQQGMVGAAASTLSSLVATAMQPTGAAAAMNDSQAQTLFTAGLGHVIDHARVPAAGRLLSDCSHTPCAPLHLLTVCVLGFADLDVGSWRVCSCCSTLVETDTSCATCGSDEKSGKDRTKVWRQGVVGCDCGEALTNGLSLCMTVENSLTPYGRSLPPYQPCRRPPLQPPPPPPPRQQHQHLNLCLCFVNSQVNAHLCLCVVKLQPPPCRCV